MYLYYTQVIIYSTFSIIELHKKSKILYYRSLILGQIELNLIIVKVEIFVFSVQFKSTKSLIALLASFSIRIDMLLLQGQATLTTRSWPNKEGNQGKDSLLLQEELFYSRNGFICLLGIGSDSSKNFTGLWPYKSIKANINRRLSRFNQRKQ